MRLDELGNRQSRESIRDIAARIYFMTPQEIRILNQACQMAGIDSSKISPSNPFEKSGGTAKMLQAAVGELDPAQAARWRVAAGSSLIVLPRSLRCNQGSN